MNVEIKVETLEISPKKNSVKAFEKLTLTGIVQTLLQETYPKRGVCVYCVSRDLIAGFES
jgi:hypothetical protein